MARKHSSPVFLLLAATLLGTACGRAKSSPSPQASGTDPIIPQGFRNTASSQELSQKNAATKALLRDFETSFGLKVQVEANDSSQSLTVNALQAFTGVKADHRLLSQSLEAEASITLISKLLSEKPSNCSTAVTSVESLYAVLTAGAVAAIAHLDQASLEVEAKNLGLSLSVQPTDPTQALSFSLTGKSSWGGLTVDQKYDVSAGANEQLLYIKRNSAVSSHLLGKAADAQSPAPELAHYTLVSTGGMTVDLAQKQMNLVDQRQADFEMLRSGSSLRGSSHLDVQNLIQGGESPRVSTDLILDLQGDGLVDETGFALYNEQRRFTSNLVKVDANTLRFTLAMTSQGVRGSHEASVEWLLQKTGDGKCQVSRQDP